MTATDAGQRDESPQLRTLERGLQILGLFDVEQPEWTFSEVCKATGLSKATAFRFLKKLEAMNYLAYDDHARSYHLGSSLLRVAYLAASDSEIVRLARPHLEELAAATGEAVNIAVGTDQGPLIVDAISAANAFQPRLLIGVVLRGLATAHSRVFAAYAPESQRLAAILSPQVQMTEHTLTDAQSLAEVLANIRREGIAFTQEQFSVGACAVAAPVFSVSGRVRATVALVVPKERFGPEDRARYAELVKRTAARVSHELGWDPTGTES